MITKVNITTDYSSIQAADPEGRLPGAQLDGDFSALEDSQNNTIDVVNSIIKREGELQDEIVGRDAFKPGFGPTIGAPRPFNIGGSYPINAAVTYQGKFYRALRAVSNATEAPVDGTTWQLIINLREGLVISEDNLAGLTDPAAARDALGLGTMAIRDSGAAADQFRNNGLNDQRFLRISEDLADLNDIDAARENLGLGGAAVSGMIQDLDTPGPGLVGRTAAGSGTLSMITPTGLLSLQNVGGQDRLVARKATLAEAEAGADVDAFVNPFLAKQAFDNVLDAVIGTPLFPNGPLFMRPDRMVHFRHEVAAGTNGPAISAGDWRTRPLNWIESSGIPGAVINGNRFELPGGMYYFKAVVQTYNAGRVRTRLQRTAYIDAPAYETNALEDTVNLSISESLAGTASNRTQMTIMQGMFTTNRKSSFEIQQQVSTTGTMGVAASFGGYRECYLDVHIFRLGDAGESSPYVAPIYLGV